MILRHTHEVGVTIRFISGEYEIEKEGMIEIDGRQVLYSIGNAMVDSSCCGKWGCRYALVHGYVRNHKFEQNATGLFISEVEPITSEDTQEIIKMLLYNEEAVHQVQFQ